MQRADWEEEMLEFSDLQHRWGGERRSGCDREAAQVGIVRSGVEGTDDDNPNRNDEVENEAEEAERDEDTSLEPSPTPPIAMVAALLLVTQILVALAATVIDPTDSIRKYNK